MLNNQLPILPDGYEYLSELGRGSQGCVWLIRNNNTGGRQEACKIVTSLSPKELSRFEREIQLLATLNHPNITTIFYASQKDRYFIMEYLPGGSLYNYCQKKILTFDQRMVLFLAIAQGLSFAHKKGLIHRDLKPENIVMTENGIPKITDFGIARSTHSESHTINVTSGTPSYMAPELWAQFPPSTASDIWSLGVILYELLTGKCPFRGTIQEICYAIREKEIKAPHVVAMLTPTAQNISEICMRMLHKDQEKRYNNCENVIHDIEKVIYQTQESKTSAVTIDFSQNISFKDDDLSKDDSFVEDDGLSFSDEASSECSESKNTVQQNSIVNQAKPLLKKPVSSDQVSNLDFQDDLENELEQQKNEETIKKVTEELPVKFVDKHRYALIGSTVAFLAILCFVFLMPPSLSKLKEKLLSRDLAQQKLAFKAMKERGEESVEYLIYGLNSPQIKMRKDILEYISKYPDSAHFYLAEAIVDTTGSFSHQAKIYAIKGLSQAVNNESVESMLANLIVSAPNDMKQEAIKSLIQVNKERYEGIYHFVDGLWQKSSALINNGYVQTGKGWKLLSKLLLPVDKKLKLASEKHLDLKKVMSRNINYIENNESFEKEVFFDQWEIIFVDYSSAFQNFYTMMQGIDKKSRDIEKKYYERIKTQIDLMSLDIAEYSDSLISLGEKSLAIRTLQQELLNITKSIEWEWPRKYKEDYKKVAISLQKKHRLLLNESTIFVYVDQYFYKQYRDPSLIVSINDYVKQAVAAENLYPRFSKSTPKEDDADHWINCVYRETDIGSYYGNKDKKRKHIRKIRSSCNFSYWVRGSKSYSWEQVISSDIYLELPKKKKSDEQQALCELSRGDFIENLAAWNPKKFDRKKIEKKKTPKDNTLRGTKDRFDIIYRKDRKKLEGLIIKEKKNSIYLLRSKMSRGKVSYVEAKINRKDIKKIKRISKEVRKKQLNDINNLRTQSSVDRKKIDKVLLETVPWDFAKGKKKSTGFLYTGKYFELYCNTPENFTREIAFRTERIFDAYQKYFPVRRNQNSKIKIYVFNSRKEYQRQIGGAFSNPAFYSPTHNHIMAGCDLAAYEKAVSRANKHNASIKKDLLREEKEIKKLRNSITKQKRNLHDKLDKQLARGQIKQRDYSAAYQNIRKQINKINREINKHLTNRKKLKNQIREYSYYNKKLIPKYIDSMISMMYHEAFHAFMQNFLFTEAQTTYVPRWLNEGLAQYFENSFISGNNLIIGKINNRRLSFLKKFVKRNGTVHAKDLLVAGYKDFIVMSEDNLENSNLHYIQSWAMVHYISTLFDMKQGDVFGQYIKDIWAGKDQVRAFENLVQKPIDIFQKEWLEFFEKQN